MSQVRRTARSVFSGWADELRAKIEVAGFSVSINGLTCSHQVLLSQLLRHNVINGEISMKLTRSSIADASLGLAKLNTESNRPQIETCAQFHSHRTVFNEGFQPGCNFDDYVAI